MTRSLSKPMASYTLVTNRRTGLMRAGVQQGLESDSYLSSRSSSRQLMR